MLYLNKRLSAFVAENPMSCQVRVNFFLCACDATLHARVKLHSIFSNIADPVQQNCLQLHRDAWSCNIFLSRKYYLANQNTELFRRSSVMLSLLNKRKIF